MTEEEANKLFFECLGEIWRDITFVEFGMRCAIAKIEGEENKFPKPPYTKGKICKNPPKSFLIGNFEELLNSYNNYFSHIQVPPELMELRHGMAHGIIARIGDNKIDEIVKFKKIKGTEDLQVEFNLKLELDKLLQIRQSVHELKGYIMEEINKK